MTSWTISIAYPDGEEDDVRVPQGMLPAKGDILNLNHSGRPEELERRWVVDRVLWYCAEEGADLFRPILFLQEQP